MNNMTKDQMQLQKKAECPMEGNCLINEVVYKCDVTRPLPKKVYQSVLKVVCFEMCTTEINYLREMPLVFI